MLKRTSTPNSTTDLAQLKEQIKILLLQLSDDVHDYSLDKTVYKDVIKSLLSVAKKIDKENSIDKLNAIRVELEPYIDPSNEFANTIQTLKLDKIKCAIIAKLELIETYIQYEQTTLSISLTLLTNHIHEWRTLDIAAIQDMEWLTHLEEQIDVVLDPIKTQVSMQDATVLKDFFQKQRYEDYIVTDVVRFATDLPGQFNKKGETLEEKIQDLAPSGQAAYRRYKAWTQLEPSPSSQLTLFSPQCYTDFARHIEKNNARTPKISECSNFAYHAAGLLLQDPLMTKKYNVCLMSIMNNAHNIAILLPKDAEITAEEKRQGQLPIGALIIDPWAIGLGHTPDVAIAVPKEQFIFKDAFPKMKINYQSKLDPSIMQHEQEETSDFTSKYLDIRTRLIQEKSQEASKNEPNQTSLLSPSK